jgi:hypothetical protein
VNRRTVRRTAFGGLVLVLALGTTRAQAAGYYIDESTDFSGNGCPSTDLNNVSKSLEDALIADGYSGSRYLNISAWPQDFIESCNAVYRSTTGSTSAGLDHVYADASQLAVYAGHGIDQGGAPAGMPQPLKGLMQFGYMKDGACWVSLSNSVRLGEMAGAQAGYSIFVTSCTLSASFLTMTFARQWLNQSLGFHNSPAVGDDQVADFYDETLYASNKDAWLDQLEDRPGWLTGSNSPMVASKGHSNAQALSTHNSTAFKAGSWFWAPLYGGPSCGAGLPGYYWYYTYLVNGDC